MKSITLPSSAAPTNYFMLIVYLYFDVSVISARLHYRSVVSYLIAAPYRSRNFIRLLDNFSKIQAKIRLLIRDIE